MGHKPEHEDIDYNTVDAGGNAPETLVGVGLFYTDGTPAGTLQQGEDKSAIGGLFGGKGLMIGNTPFRGGEFVTATGKHVFLDPTGKVIDQRTLSEGERESFFTGNGAGGGSGQIVNNRAPDPVNAINAMLEYYKMQVAEAGMPRQQAIEEFNRQVTIIEAQQQNETTQGTFDQNAVNWTNQNQSAFDQNQITKTRYQQMDELQRQEDQVSRAQNIQEELGRRQRSLAQDILPRSIQGLMSADIPLLGNVRATQINPDQFYDIQGLNNIPNVPLQSQYNFPDMAAPTPIPRPVLSPVNAGMFPQLPTPPQVALPNIDSLIGEVRNGNPGYVRYV